MKTSTSEKRLIILLGPTGSGKTDYSISLAKKYDSPIISCDSRQLYREMSIGTAVPSKEQLQEVKHYFIQDHSVRNPYTAGMYEAEALSLIKRLYGEGHETLVMCGGSMFYIDALCNGIADVPKADPELRENLSKRLRENGVDDLAAELKILDKEAWSTIDIKNGARVQRALEVCLSTGKPFSSFKMKAPAKRNFKIEKTGIFRTREDLSARISRRVDKMVEDGLIEEVRSLNEFRNLTALQTVGYREVFEYLDSRGTISLEETLDSIKSNTRNYAKRQMTWWKRDSSINWISIQH